MIGKQTKGKSFRGLLGYTLGKEKAQLIGGNMIGRTPRDLAHEFGLSRALRPKLSRAVYHCSLNLSVGETFSDEQWGEVAEQYLQQMGFLSKAEQAEAMENDAQYIVVRHSDAEHEHVHIVASRIRLDGSVVSDSHDFRRSEVAIRELEKVYGLQSVESSFAAAPGAIAQVRISRAEMEIAQRLGVEVPPKMLLGSKLDRAVELCAGEPGRLEAMLLTVGVEVPRQWTNLRNRRTDATFALSEAVEGMQSSFSGVHIGRDYEWERLAERVIEQAVSQSAVLDEEQSKLEGEGQSAQQQLSAAEEQLQQIEAELVVWQENHPHPAEPKVFAFSRKHQLFYSELSYLGRELNRLCEVAQQEQQHLGRQIAAIEGQQKPGLLNFAARLAWQERQQEVPELKQKSQKLAHQLAEYRQMMGELEEYEQRKHEWTSNPQHQAIRQRLVQQQQWVYEQRDRVYEQQQREQVRQHLPQLLENLVTAVESWGWQEDDRQVFDGVNYWIAVKEQSYWLFAKDGRGKLLEVENGQLRHCEVELADVEHISGAVEEYQQEQEEELERD